jgi:hypothetical protein
MCFRQSGYYAAASGIVLVNASLRYAAFMHVARLISGRALIPQQLRRHAMQNDLGVVNFNAKGS